MHNPVGLPHILTGKENRGMATTPLAVTEPPASAVEKEARGGASAYLKLREAIVDGRFQPNERLVEADLARTFGVGRTAVRAALVRLDQEGLVERQPNRGARVRLVSDREALEIEEVRVALEQMLARHAATRITGADVENLR
jgi:DNA-binding GntR family transcriptional regulator